ncbi:type II secretion system F family protein [Salimicrobium halophilum]|uniref:Competence-related pilin export protein ComGB n=1 Tax=Salimicrobium halophilum TaxID=86666 RepID=A0A1G8PT35_9BACI|nr:type II secretion system F family protein [Salimicrobium halophilum]SDI95709.1 competence-related pilin export protein ComGB [Salimicrobium halophilum]
MDIFNRKQLPLPVQIHFFKRMSPLLEKGYPVHRALDITGWDEDLKPLTSELLYHFKKGDSLEEAFRKARFSPMVISFLYFGKVRKDFPSLFRQCYQLLVISHDSKKKLWQTLRYPLILLLFLFITFYFMKKSVIPSFESLYAHEEDKPWSLFIFQGLDYTITLVTGLGFLFLTAFLIYKIYAASLPMKRKLEIYKRIPYVQMVKSYIVSYQFAIHASSMLKAGFSLNQVLDILIDQQKQKELSFSAKTMLLSLSEGNTLAMAANASTLMRKEIISVFHEANDNQALADELSLLAFHFLDQLKTKTEKTIELIHPIVLSVAALIIISIYLSIMLPLYNWIQVY